MNRLNTCYWIMISWKLEFQQKEMRGEKGGTIEERKRVPTNRHGAYKYMKQPQGLFRLSSPSQLVLVGDTKLGTPRQLLLLQWRGKSSIHRIDPRYCASCLRMPNQMPAIITNSVIKKIFESTGIWGLAKLYHNKAHMLHKH